MTKLGSSMAREKTIGQSSFSKTTSLQDQGLESWIIGSNKEVLRKT